MRLGERRWPPAPDTGEQELLMRVAASQVWTDGPWTAEAETRLAAITRAGHAVAFSSCTAAIHAALHALGCTRETQVVAPALSFAGTVTGARHIGARLTFTDVLWDELTISPPPLDEGAGIVIGVDLHGVPHGMPRRDSSGWKVLTDACQSLGTRLNTHIGGPGLHAWSFSPSKIVAAPDGGAITTSDEDLAEHLRELRDYGLPAGQGGRGRSNSAVQWPGGHNWRPSELSMAMVAWRLPLLDKHARWARAVASRVHCTLDELGWWRQRTVDGIKPTWHKIRFGPFSLHPADARRLEQRLTAAGVPVHRWGHVPLHQHPAFRPPRQPKLKVAETMAAGTLCLGSEEWPPWTWTDEETGHVCRVLETIAEDFT